jgi:saccharopine dehydrogenase-like NADP-dependent oxidoreductase
MTIIAIVGAGEMGFASLRILERRLPDARFRVFDRNPESLAKARALNPDRIDTEEADVSLSPPQLDGSDLVVSFAGPFFEGSDVVAQAALAAGCTYLDICDDVNGIQPIIALDEAAKEAGVALVTGAGNSPGTSNVMAKRLLEMFPECDGIRIVWIVRDTDPGGLAPLRHMLHMAVAPCPIWQDGKFVDAPGYLPGTAREYDLPELGPTLAYNTAHSEPITLARAFPFLRHASVQGALLPAWSNETFSTLGRIGFGYDDLSIEVGGQEVEPVEVLWKVLWARHERRKRSAPADEERGGLTVVQVQALTGDDVHATMTLVDPHSMVRTTAIGAAAAVLAVLGDQPPAGAWGTEILDADRTLAIVTELAAEEGAIPNGFVLDTLAPTT